MLRTLTGVLFSLDGIRGVELPLPVFMNPGGAGGGWAGLGLVAILEICLVGVCC